jgi:hypothetical protein
MVPRTQDYANEKQDQARREWYTFHSRIASRRMAADISESLAMHGKRQGTRSHPRENPTPRCPPSTPDKMLDLNWKAAVAAAADSSCSSEPKPRREHVFPQPARKDAQQQQHTDSGSPLPEHNAHAPKAVSVSGAGVCVLPVSDATLTRCAPPLQSPRSKRDGFVATMCWVECGTS